MASASRGCRGLDPVFKKHIIFQVTERQRNSSAEIFKGTSVLGDMLEDSGAFLYLHHEFVTI
jgi:hypothetical protein